MFLFGLLKGQLISVWIFGVFKSPQKPTKFLTDFCPSFIGQKSVKNVVSFLGDLKTTKFHSKINWPLPISTCIVRADLTLLWNLKYILKKAMGHLRVKNSENLKESIKELSANMSISPFFELWKSWVLRGTVIRMVQ